MALVFCVIILIFNITLWIIFFKFIKKSFSAKGLLTDIKQEAGKIINEINRETDTAITLMESKINLVREIIDIAEKKIILYENTLVQKENEKQLYQQLSDFNKKNTPVQRAVKGYKSNSSESDYLPLFTENAGTSDLKKSINMQEIDDSQNNEKTTKSSKKIPQENLELDFSEEPKVKISKSDDKIEPKISVQEQIIKLAKEGFTAELIASKLNVSINVVTMTIDLYL